MALDKGNKYRKKMKSTTIDVYDILKAYEVTCPAIAHAVKKLLVAGQRGNKNTLTDLSEAHWQIERAIQLEKEDE